MISAASEYIYTTGDLDKITIDNEVMPNRQGLAQKMIRGVDIAFLLESVEERSRAQEAVITQRRFSRIPWYDQLDIVFDGLQKTNSSSHNTGSIAIDPTWPYTNLSIYEENIPAINNAPPIIANNNAIIAAFPNFYQTIESIPQCNPGIARGTSKLMAAEPLQAAFRNQKKLTRYLDRVNYTLSATTPTQSPVLPEADARRMCSWRAEAPANWDWTGQPTYTDKQRAYYTAGASAANHLRREHKEYYGKFSFDNSLGIYVWEGYTRRSRNANGSIHVTRSNLPLGAVVTPLVQWQAYSYATYTHAPSNNRHDAVTETYSSGRTGLVFAAPKIADSAGTVTFTWNELRSSTGGTGNADMTWDDIPSTFKRYVGYEISAASQNPPQSEVPTTRDAWSAHYTSWLEYSLYGLLIDLGDHTKWWQ